MDYLTNDTELIAVADAIREKCETTDPLEWPDGFIQAIEDCQTGGPELEWLWGNQITNTLSGTIDSTDDAYAGPILNLDVDGVSEQVTTTGKNLLPNDRFCKMYYNQTAGTVFDPATSGSGIVADNGDGTFTMTAASEWAGVSFYTDVLPAGDYRLKFAFSGATPRVSVEFVDAETMQFIGTPINYTSSSTHDRIHTISNTSIIVVGVASSSAGTVTITQPQLEAGSTATDYEPYTGGKPSPNPDYPQEILSVDEPTLMVVGKNLFDFTMFDKSSSSYGGCALTRNGNGSWLLSGTNTLEYEWNFNSNAGEQTFSAGTYRLMNVGGSLVGCSLLVTTDIPNHTTVYEGKFTADAPFKVTKWAIRVAVNATIGGTARPAIVSYDATIPLYDGTIRSLPDGTKDELHLTYLKPSKDHEGWAWYEREVVKRCEGKTFDGTDTTGWIVIPGTYPYYEYTWTTTGAGDTAYTGLTYNNSRCNVCTRKQFSNASNTIGYGNTNHHMRFRYQDMTGKTGSLRDLAEFFTGTPTTFVLPMQTPITTQLDPIELPIMPSENATVWCDGGSAQPTFMLEYIQNANIVISRLEDTIADLATS